MLATRISFINEMASLSELLGANIESVRWGIDSDPGIDYDYISLGCGYGGSCLPKDMKALVSMADQVNYSAGRIEAVERVNSKRKLVFFQRLLQALNGELHAATVAIWGLAFKPGTDDMREAPGRPLIESYDPEAMSECSRIYGQRQKLKYCNSKEEALLNAGALAGCTGWDSF